MTAESKLYRQKKEAATTMVLAMPSYDAGLKILTKTFDDFRSRVMKRLLLLDDHPKLFILSNNKWMKRLFRSYKLADGRYCMEWFSIFYLFYIYYCS